MPAAGSEGDEGPACSPAGPGAPKLCGYLQKLSGKGPLRGFRSRWFVFDPRRCYLYYFKGPQEALPLGHIDIASACFSYHQPEAAAAAAGDEAAAFEVHGPGGAVAVLKVGRGGRPCAGPAALGRAGAPGTARTRSDPPLPAPDGASCAAFRPLVSGSRSDTWQRRSRCAVPDGPERLCHLFLKELFSKSRPAGKGPALVPGLRASPSCAAGPWAGALGLPLAARRLL